MNQNDLRNGVNDFIKYAESELLNIPFSEVSRLQDEHVEWLTSIDAYLVMLNYKGINYYEPSELDTKLIEYKIDHFKLIDKIKEEIELLRKDTLPNLLKQILVPQKMGNQFSDPYYIEGYEKKEKIGNGGYGEVYRYNHNRLDLDFAIKFFDKHTFNEDPSGLERFFQEAKILHTLNHPRIIRIYDVNMRQDRPYFRMDYIKGKTLKDIGILTPKESLGIIKQIAEGLKYAHSKNIIHRDLKESNIIVCDGKNDITIIDFGIGAFIDANLDKNLTTTGDTAVGGPHTAPELYDNPKLRDERSDIYSIGYLWFKLLTGLGNQGKSIDDVLHKLQIKEEIIVSLKKCLDSIDNRYKTCEELLSDLNSIII
ncbi:MAG: protein kinase family protein [Bacillales bacterium]|nr:protein kinase family protein [Bacillales bacterium]